MGKSKNGEKKKGKAKWIVIAVAAIIVVGGIAGSGGKNDDGDTKNKKAVVTENASEQSESSNNESNSEESKTNEKEEVPADGSASVAIEENQVLWESEGVKVTATGIEKDSLWGDQVKLLIENNSDKNIMVGCDALIINDFMVNDLFATSVAAGKKDNAKITLLSGELKTAGIKEISNIELYLHITDDDTLERISKSDCLPIKVSNAVPKTDVDIPGTELYNDNGIRIVGQHVDSSGLFGTDVMLYIENTSDKKVSIIADGVSVNGFMTDSMFSETVYPSKKAYSKLTLFESALEENNISEIENIELTFRLREEESYDLIAESDPITFSCK